MADDRTTVFVARRFHTMEPGFPTVEAVAVRAGRILAVGSFETVTGALGDEPFDVDERLQDLIVLPGLIDQHLHPLLAATTLAMEVIATEDWLLPDRTFPAARSHDEYVARLAAAERSLVDDPAAWLTTWGYHALWHGRLDRSVLDDVSATRPIAVWHRSCHELLLNSAAITELGITAESVAGRGPASGQIDLDRGHFWEAGFFNIVMAKVAPHIISRERVERGLRQLVAYLHQHGVTAINEPGIAWAVEPFDLYQEILGADEVPFRTSFLVDGRTQAVRSVDPGAVIDDALEQIARAPIGKVSLLSGQVKMFADGAIISQLMQMRDPYLDASGLPDPAHHGEWMVEPDVLETYFRVYWEAGWQIHTHVNGDRGLDVLLDIIERCMIAHPRADHRSVIVHFANSTEEQVDRLARLACIVSANPYYPVGFADRYAEFGLGPERADTMVRSASVLDRSVPLAFHSDLPMAPAEPLALASFAVNRITETGRVAAPEQRIGVHDALRAVTIEAAYSWRLEHELGSIAPGKTATFTVLGADPYEVDPAGLRDVPVVGSVFEGRWFPVPDAHRRDLVGQAPRLVALPGSTSPLGSIGRHHEAYGCSCDVARHLAHAWRTVADLRHDVA
jgi:predicted amidohydrolase YtcJ